MKAKLKKKWIDTLRGEGDYIYDQGRAYLCAEKGSEHRYCCLGVLLDIAVLDGLITPRVARHPAVDGAYSWDGNYRLPSTELLDALGLAASAALALTRRNDDGVAFAVLADYVEELCW